MNELNIYNIPANIYNGCGKVWAAIKDGQIVAIRYMGSSPLPDRAEVLKSCNRVRGNCPTARRAYEDAQRASFKTYRQQCRDELATLGEVVSGMASAYEFIPNQY